MQAPTELTRFDTKEVSSVDPDAPLLCRTLDRIEEFGQHDMQTFRAKLLQLAAATAATIFMFWFTNRNYDKK